MLYHNLVLLKIMKLNMLFRKMCLEIYLSLNTLLPGFFRRVIGFASSTSLIFSPLLFNPSIKFKLFYAVVYLYLSKA